MAGIGDHPAIARCMATGYPYPAARVRTVQCGECGENIYLGLDEYFDFGGGPVCEHCRYGYVQRVYGRGDDVYDFDGTVVSDNDEYAYVRAHYLKRGEEDA